MPATPSILRFTTPPPFSSRCPPNTADKLRASGARRRASTSIAPSSVFRGAEARAIVSFIRLFAGTC